MKIYDKIKIEQEFQKQLYNPVTINTNNILLDVSSIT